MTPPKDLHLFVHAENSLGPPVLLGGIAVSRVLPTDMRNAGAVPQNPTWGRSLSRSIGGGTRAKGYTLALGLLPRRLLTHKHTFLHFAFIYAWQQRCVCADGRTKGGWMGYQISELIPERSTDTP